MTFPIRRLAPGDVQTLRALNELFADVFNDAASYRAAPPDDAWIERLLDNDACIVLVAQEATRVVGGLVAYVLPKFEQARSEVYIYDLAVAADRRRHGIATALIEALKPVATASGAWVIYVQADHGDEPAIALYSRHGVREDVLHFDIAVAPAAHPHSAS